MDLFMHFPLAFSLYLSLSLPAAVVSTPSLASPITPAANQRLDARKAEVAPAPKLTPAQAKEARAIFASIALKELLAAQAEMVASPREDHVTILMLASGSLNHKFEFMAEDFVARGEATTEETILGMSFALEKLSNLAQALGLHEASRCYHRESRVMRQIAQGTQATPIGCRNNIFSADQQAAAIRGSTSTRSAKLQAMANRWTTKALMFGLDSAKIEAN